jgi:hypothetical protein
MKKAKKLKRFYIEKLDVYANESYLFNIRTHTFS